MPEEIELNAGRWWRWSEYELRMVGDVPARSYQVIVRAPNAKLAAYEPWKEWDLRHRPRKSKSRPAPYEELVSLLEDVRYEGHERADDDMRQSRVACPLPLNAESGVAVLAWCQKWGLLGVLLHRTIAVTLAPHTTRPPIPGARSLPVQSSYVRMPYGWLRREIALPSPQPAEALIGSALSTVDESGPRPEPLRTTWARFFPDVSPECAENYAYPMPLSDAFWKEYGEPVADFLDGALALKVALEGWRAADVTPRRRKEGEAVARGQRALDKLASVVQTTSLSRPRASRTQLAAPSLIAAFASMMVQDAWVGSARKCECGVLFVANAQPKAKYCSERCRERFKKRRQVAEKLAAKKWRQQARHKTEGS